jgi:hypothetical protein
MRKLLRKTSNVHLNVTLRRLRETFFFPWKSNNCHILCVCVCSISYPARKAHALYYIVICGLTDYTVLFHIVSSKARFLKRKRIEYKVCFLIFSQILSERFLIVRKIQRDVIIHVHRSSYKTSIIIVRF